MIISPEEYERLSEVEENYILLTEATKRLNSAKESDYIPAEKVMEHLGLTQEDIDNTEDVKIK